MNTNPSPPHQVLLKVKARAPSRIGPLIKASVGNWRSKYHGACRGEQEEALGAHSQAQGSLGDVPWDTASFEEGTHTVLVNKLSHCLHIQPLSGAAVPTLKTRFPPHLNLSPEQGVLQLIHSELEGVAVCLSDLTLQVDRNQLDFRIQVGTKGEAPIGGGGD